MKKLVVMMAVGLMALSSPAFALVDIGVFGGFTTVEMGDINTEIENKAGVDTVPFSGGYLIGLEGAVSVMPFLSLGIRGEYVSASDATMKSRTSGYTSRISASLIPIMVGGSLRVGAPLSDLAIRLNAFAGIGLAKTGLSSDAPGSRDNNFEGTGFVGELSADIRYSVMPMVELGVSAGYRVANIAEVNSTQTVGTLQDGDPWKSGNKILSVDFSGLIMTGGIYFHF